MIIRNLIRIFSSLFVGKYWEREYGQKKSGRRIYSKTIERYINVREPMIVILSGVGVDGRCSKNSRCEALQRRSNEEEKKNRQQNAFNLMRKSVCGFNLYNSFRAVCVCVRRGELF